MRLRENKGAANSIVVMLMVFILILICLLFWLVKHPMVKYVEKDTVNTQAQANVVETKTQVSENNIDISKFIGNWYAEFGPDGPVNIKIEDKNITWIYDEFNGSPSRTVNVNSYSIENDKLIINLEKNDYYPESKFIIYKENGKMYITIEKVEKGDYFPIELEEVISSEVKEKLLDRVRFVGDLEFTSTNKITQSEIHNLLVNYFDKNNFANVDNFSETQIKKLVKDILNLDYSGNFNFISEAGGGEYVSKVEIINLEKEGNNYVVEYKLENSSEATNESITKQYYKAKINENLVFISNKKVTK